MPETIGRQLKQARDRRNLTIEKVVEGTRLRARHIEALEADDFESLASPVQVRAFLRIYAEFLGLSMEELIERQRGGGEEKQDEQKQKAKKQDGEKRNAKQGEQKLEAQNRDEQKQKAKKQEAQKQNAEEGAEEPAPEVEAEAEAMVESGASKTTALKEKFRQILGAAQRLLPRRKVSPTPAEPEVSAAAVPEESQEEPGPQVQGTPEEVPPVLPAGKQESQAIFASIGAALRQRREILSLTLDEIENHTRVRQYYLRALEAGQFDLLPSSVQARGMLHNYASFLNMDVEAVLSQFAEGLQMRRLERQPGVHERHAPASSKPASQGNALPTGLRRFLSMDILAGGGLVVLLIAFAIWGAARVFATRSEAEPEGTAPAISDILGNVEANTTLTPLSTAEGEATVLLPTAEGTAAATLPQVEGGGAVQVVVVAHESAWVRVTVDGQKQFEGRVTAGKAYPYDGNTQIQVLTGNGAALSILYNQTDLGTMGAYGQVVDRIYTVSGIINPTPTPTLTPTITLTPRFSPTPGGSATPTPSPTP